MNIEEFNKDWRNMGQMDYLFNKKLIKQKEPDILNDHHHCEFCWEKISNKYRDAVHEGYCTENHKYWICPKCFGELNHLFKWKII